MSLSFYYRVVRAETAASADAAPKKRKRRDIKKLSLEANEVKRLDAAVKSKAAARKSTTSAVGTPDLSDKELFSLHASSKQAAQKRKKDAQDRLPRHDGGKTRERSISEQDQVISRLCGSAAQNVKDTDTDKADLRQVGKGDLVERLNTPAFPANPGELQLLDNSDWDEFKRETTVLSLSKVKPAQKGSTYEIGREASGVMGGLKHGNTVSLSFNLKLLLFIPDAPFNLLQ